MRGAERKKVERKGTKKGVKERKKERKATSGPRIVGCIYKKLFLVSSSCTRCMLAVHLMTMCVTQIACACYIALNVWMLMIWKEAIVD